MEFLVGLLSNQKENETKIQMEFGTLLVTCSAIDFAQERTVTGVV
jgi:hypothetical protein